MQPLLYIHHHILQFITFPIHNHRVFVVMMIVFLPFPPFIHLLFASFPDGYDTVVFCGLPFLALDWEAENCPKNSRDPLNSDRAILKTNM